MDSLSHLILLHSLWKSNGSYLRNNTLKTVKVSSLRAVVCNSNLPNKPSLTEVYITLILK